MYSPCRRPSLRLATYLNIVEYKHERAFALRDAVRTTQRKPQRRVEGRKLEHTVARLLLSRKEIFLVKRLSNFILNTDASVGVYPRIVPTAHVSRHVLAHNRDRLAREVVLALFRLAGRKKNRVLLGKRLLLRRLLNVLLSTRRLGRPVLAHEVEQQLLDLEHRTAALAANAHALRPLAAVHARVAAARLGAPFLES